MLLAPFKEQQIKALLEAGYSLRTTARMAGVARNTVRRVHRETPRKRCFQDAWKALEAHRKEIHQLFFSCKANCSAMMRYLEAIIGPTLPSQRNLQRFCADFRREWRRARHEKTGRFETSPGYQMQIDFGETRVPIDGEEVKIHLFVCVLGYSRRGFIKIYDSETQENWMDGIISAINYFEGVPYEIVCDNAKALVKNPNARGEERYTERFYSLCQHFDMCPAATAVRKPNWKGKVESYVRYAKNNALVNVDVETMDELNEYMVHWSRTIADVRVLADPLVDGPSTPAERFEVEKRFLRPITKPLTPARWTKRTVDKNGLIRVDYAIYRVPDQFAERRADVVVGKDTLAVSYGGRTVTLDKAKDRIGAKNGDWSKGPESKVKFDDKIKELEQSEEWRQMQNPQCQRDPSAYDAAFRQGV